MLASPTAFPHVLASRACRNKFAGNGVRGCTNRVKKGRRVTELHAQFLGEQGERRGGDPADADEPVSLQPPNPQPLTLSSQPLYDKSAPQSL